MNTRPENLQRFHVSNEGIRQREISAFLDEQGNSRVLIDGKVQPVRNSPFTVLHPASQQTLRFDSLGEYVDMRIAANRERFPECFALREIARSKRE